MKKNFWNANDTREVVCWISVLLMNFVGILTERVSLSAVAVFIAVIHECREELRMRGEKMNSFKNIFSTTVIWSIIILTPILLMYDRIISPKVANLPYPIEVIIFLMVIVADIGLATLFCKIVRKIKNLKM